MRGMIPCGKERGHYDKEQQEKAVWYQGKAVFPPDYVVNDPARCAKVTAYAKAQGGVVYSEAEYACMVQQNMTETAGGGVRPAFRLNPEA